MRARSGCRPMVEALESLTLLSSLSWEPHHATSAPPAIAVEASVSLSGTLHGSFKTNAAGKATTSGSSTLGPIGKVTISGGLSTTDTSVTGTLRLTNKQGTILLNLDLTPTGQGGFSGKYTIQGGTKAFAGETGSGLVVGMLSGAKRGKFTATFS